MARRRAYVDEYAVLLNWAVALPGAGAVRALQAEHALSERQARRYVGAALVRPEGWRCQSTRRCSPFVRRRRLIAGLRLTGCPAQAIAVPERRCVTGNDRRDDERDDRERSAQGAGDLGAGGPERQREEGTAARQLAWLR